MGRTGEKEQGIRSINGRYKIDRRRLRVVWEMEKPKNLYDPWTWTKVGQCLCDGGVKGGGEERGRKKWDNCNSIINKIYFKNVKESNNQ